MYTTSKGALETIENAFGIRPHAISSTSLIRDTSRIKHAICLIASSSLARRPYGSAVSPQTYPAALSQTTLAPSRRSIYLGNRHSPATYYTPLARAKYSSQCCCYISDHDGFATQVTSPFLDFAPDSAHKKPTHFTYTRHDSDSV